MEIVTSKCKKCNKSFETLEMDDGYKISMLCEDCIKRD